MSRIAEFIQFAVISLVVNSLVMCATSVGWVQAVKKCPGKCMGNITECKSKGGKITGWCTNELPCCDYTFIKLGSCGATKSKLNTAIFRSPDYPQFSEGNLVCPFEFVLSPNATGILVDFVHVVMDGVGFQKNSPCESDMFLFKGFPYFTPPPQCGNLTNYVAAIDLGSNQTKHMRSLTILALMSGKKYRWSIKVTQTFEKKMEKSEPTTTTTPSPPTGREDDDSNDDFPDEIKMVSPEERSDGIGYEDLLRLIENNRIDRAYFTGNPPVGRPQSRRRVVVGFDSDSGFWDTDTEIEPDLDLEPFIVNGEETDISTTPWQASLRQVVGPKLAEKLEELKIAKCTINEGLHFCGGSIISDRHILSATHCFYTDTDKFRTWQALDKVKVVLGDSNLCDESTDGVQEFHVEKVFFHYAYDRMVIMNDVVVIQLDKKIKFTEKVKKIKMVEPGVTFEHVEAIGSGWGLTNLTIGTKAKTPNQLQYAEDLFVGNASECLEEQMKLFAGQNEDTILKFPKYENVFDSLLCSYVRNMSVPRVVGQGDSGGPLVVNVPSPNGASKDEVEPILIGIISYMVQIKDPKDGHDVSNYVDFFQSVAFYRKWIELTMQNIHKR